MNVHLYATDVSVFRLLKILPKQKEINVTAIVIPENRLNAIKVNELVENREDIPVYVHKRSNWSPFELPDADIAISWLYSQIIPPNILETYHYGILNMHGGRIPQYRGGSVLQWAIINGEDKIGLCIHSMIGGELDSGNIIEREYLNINSNTKVTECWQWMEKRIPFMFLNSVQKLQENSEYFLEEQSKDCKDVLRCYPRVLSDGKINWIKSNIEILRLINASNKPYSGAYCFYKNEKMIIWDAEIYEDNEIYLSEPRQVLMINKDGSIIIATGNGKLKINEVECNGHIMKPKDKVMTIRDRLE